MQHVHVACVVSASTHARLAFLCPLFLQAGRRLTELCVGLLDRLVALTDLTSKRAAVMAVRLWTLALKQQPCDTKRMARIRAHALLLANENAEDSDLVQALTAVSAKFV